MNMLNRNCKTSFVKPEFLKKAQRANPRLYDIGCYNDNLALMLALESDKMIRVAHESRSKLSDLIKPFDYKNLNNLYDLFVPQREKSPEQRYFSERSKMSHTPVKNENSKESFNKQTTLLEKQMDESIPWDQKCKCSKENFKIKSSVDTIFAKRIYFGHIDPFIQNTIEGYFCPQIQKINANLEIFYLCLKKEMVADLKYFNSLEYEVDSLKSQLETKKTQFLNEIDGLSREYCYADHMNAMLGVYTTLDEFTDFQCDYVDQVVKCERLEKELSKRTNNVNNKSFNELSKRFFKLEQHSINLELTLQQNLKAQLQDKDIAISELKKLIEKMKGKYVETKFEKPSVIRQLNAFKTQRQSVLGTVKFRNDQIASIIGYGDLVQGNVTIKRVYYVEGLNRNLFSVGQLCDADLEVAFQKSTCYIRDLKGNDLLIAETVTTSNEMDFLFSLMFEELLNGTTQVVSKSSAITATDAPNQHQQQNTTPSTSTTIAADIPPLNIQTTHETTSQAPTVTANENINQTETNKEYAQVDKDEFIKIFSTPIQGRGETSSRYVDSSNMHTFYQRNPSEYRWTKDHLLKQVIGNPSQSIKTRRQLETDGEMCMFALTVSRTEPKNNKEAMVDSAWIEAMQEELHQFDRLDSLGLKASPVFVAVIVHKSFPVLQMDVKNKWVPLKEDVYVNHPDGFCRPNIICKVYHLKKELYGLITATWTWDVESLHFWLSKMGSSQKGVYDSNMFITKKVATKPLDADLSGTPVDQTKYHSMVEALMYLTASRPDIVHATCYCARYQARPTEKHLREVKRIFRYLKNTINMGLWYPKDTGFNLTAFLDLDHAGRMPSMSLAEADLSSGPQSQENIPQAAETVTTQNELDLLFSLMFDELLNGTTQVVSKSSAVTTADAPNQRQQQHTTPSTSTIVVADPPTLNNQTITETTSQAPTQAPTVTANENIIQAETNKEHAQVDEDKFINIFSTLPYGFVDPHHPDNVYRLKKALYGLKQAPRAWYDELSNFLVSKGFSKGSIDPTLFITKKGEDILLVQIYVDDIIFGSTNPKLSKKFEKLMHIKFEMSMTGELKFFLGIQIHQSPRAIFINQAKYAQEILKNHGMTSCDSVGTLMATKPLDADLSGTPVDQTKYRSMVEALMYLTPSRSDIGHATCYCARYQARPTKKHPGEVKWIFRYLMNTINIGIWYPKDTGFNLTAFSDSNHAGCLDTRKSTSGGIQFLGGDKLVSWSSKKQDYASMSSAEAKYHFIKEHVEKGIVELFFIGIEYQLADLFTEALSEDRFKYLVKRLDMRCLTLEELEVLANEYA
ncbi:retrovirus-related pol polyprotein from transposon TNT 1-94 [Tanacetum coccineum]